MGQLVCENIQKRYGKKNVLNGVNLTIEQGKIYGLIGRNGGIIMSGLMRSLKYETIDRAERSRKDDIVINPDRTESGDGGQRILRRHAGVGKPRST